jgi:NADPH2:quinone reductase
MMKAVICNAWGDPSPLTLEDVPAKAPGAGEVRLRVRACGVNFADALMIQGKYQVRPPFPFSPGLEAAGDVLEVGAGVTHLKPGDRVLCITSYGGMAEELVVPAEMVIPMPPSMDYAVAAGFPIAYGTSHVALDHRAHLQPGETLLVLGAAGGVGLTAVEIGKKLGATVIAAASTPEKLALTREYGADYTIEYTRENLRDRLKDITGGRGVNVVYDPVGGDMFDPALRSIAWEGRYLVVGFASGTIPQLPANLMLMKNASVVGVLWGAYAANSPAVLRASLGTLLGWYAEGALRPHISQTFLLEHAADALWSLLRRQSTGKVVVEIA